MAEDTVVGLSTASERSGQDISESLEEGFRMLYGYNGSGHYYPDGDDSDQ